MGWVFVSLTRRIVISVLTALVALGAESVQQLYERARLLEERNRNLDEAIRIYGLVVEQAKGDRALAGRALLEQGKLHLRLGHDEPARQAFRRVIVDFSDQPALVREARDRLGINGLSKSTLSVRPVWATPDSDNSGGPSPDGRYLSYTDWSSGDIGIRDMITGEKRHLTQREAGQALSSIFSADSKRVAYWRTDWNSFNEVRIVDVEGGAPPRTLCRVLDAAQVSLTDWSRDGKSILAYLEHKSSSAEIVLISVADGSIHTLKPNADRPGRMSFSPDGRFVLFNGPGSDGPDVHLLTINSGRDVALAPHPAEDFVAGWSPDGSRILFTSNRTGPLSLWTLAVKDGEAQGEPQLVLADAGNIEPLGITRNGSLYYWLKTGLVDIYTAAIDPERAIMLDAPKPFPHRFVASNQFPDWSPNGKNLLYQSNRPGSDSLIVIRSLDTGIERDLRTTAPLGSQPPRWTAVGDAILVSGVLAGKRGIYRIDPQTGAAALSVPLPDSKFTFTPAWSPDGKTLFGRLDGYRAIHRMDIANRSVQTLYQTRRDGTAYEETGPSEPLLSPDGRSLLFQVRDRSRTDSLLIMSPEGGPPHRLITLISPEQFPAGSYAWTPDSRRVVYVHRNGKQFQISVISAEGGEPRRTGLVMNSIRFMRMHPDGKRIAFQSGETDGEVWVIQNLF